MSKSQDLKKQLIQAREHLANLEAKSQHDELGDFFVRPMLAHVQELSKEQTFAESQERLEVVEFRLFGGLVNTGSIPLRTLSNIAGPFYEWISAAAHHLRYGDDEKPIGTDIDQALDLRLAGIGLGSTRLFFTGNTSGDLTGERLLVKTLHNLFALLNSDHEVFYDALHNIGHKSASKLSDLIKALSMEGLSVNLSWGESSNHVVTWDGKRDEIGRIAQLLSVVSEATHEDVEMRGHIVLLSETGRIQIRDPDFGTKYSIKYASEQYQLVKKLRLGMFAELKVRMTQFRHPATHKTIEKYLLIDVLKVMSK